MTTAREYAHSFADRGLHVHPNWWIVWVEDDDTGTTSPDCACPEFSDSRNPETGLCNSAGKHPIVPFTQASTTSHAQIDEWWDAYPDANLGVRTDGITVADIDYRSGGLQTWTLLEREPGTFIVPTLTVKTGNGFHCYFAGEAPKAGGKLGKGIDFKSGPTAQVVGPGSTHASGAEYELLLDVPIAAPASPVVPDRSTPPTHEAVVERSPVATQKAGPGERNDFLVTRGATLRNYINDREVFHATMQMLGARECDPPADPSRVEEIAAALWKRDGGDDWRALLAGVDVRSVPDTGHVVTGEDVARLLSKLRNIDAILQQPPMQWTIDGILPDAELSILFGDGGSKKSFIALDWMLSAVYTGAWHDRSITPGTALYVAAEGMAGMNQRIRAWSAARGITLDEMRRKRRDDEHGFVMLPEAINLRSSEVVAEAKALAESIALDYIVVDTFRRATSGADENSAKDMGEAIEGAAQLTTFGAKVILVHHSPKNTALRPRGHSSLFDDVDVVLNVSRHKSNPLVSILSPSKLKDAAEFDPIHVTFTSYDVLLEGDGEMPAVATSSLASTSLLVKAEGEPATEEETAASIEDTLDAEARFHRSLQALEPEQRYTKEEIGVRSGYPTKSAALRALLEGCVAQGLLVRVGTTRNSTWHRPSAHAS